MRQGIVLLLACALAAGFAAPASIAQIPDYGENHYLVYDVTQTGIVFPVLPDAPPITLRDEFDNLFSTDLVELDLFANPAVKVREGFPPEVPVNGAIHQTWWPIDDSEVPRRLLIENQFELPGTWYIRKGKYLVLPASKGETEDIDPPVAWNHYKCYEEVSDDPEPLIFDPPLAIIDQFGTWSVTQLTRIYFCLPCQKEVGPDPEDIFPVVNSGAHLAVYRIEAALTNEDNRWVFDQFGTTPREITIVNPMWLVVPSLKIAAVSSEANTWGGVKSLYR